MAPSTAASKETVVATGPLGFHKIVAVLIWIVACISVLLQDLSIPCRALASALECVGQASGGRSIELLRKESLAGLAPAAACRVLSHAYLAVVPIAPLPYPPLPLSPSRPGSCSPQLPFPACILLAGSGCWWLSESFDVPQECTWACSFRHLG